ncbi:hypothetical protein SCLCIDRAFT_1116944 [Scleroderma citrinum Foug A]|uniref:Uncharacterized protein n=1 Tax=Scleroderma citrinum Foug A TaxID=1036808 RepID=A0A0C3DAN1_9AGAM|nr:hypothetical protein SCLCIDRAFT_1116944 [Scleroderma citrinum Foug A]
MSAYQSHRCMKPTYHFFAVEVQALWITLSRQKPPLHKPTSSLQALSVPMPETTLL